MPPPSHPSASDGAGEQYFSVAPTSASKPADVELALPDLHLRLRTDAGVFSPGRIDAGTKLLLLELAAVEQWPVGPVADVGCGYGAIAVTMARRAPDREVWAVDVNERSLDLCRENATAAGVADRLHVVKPDEVPAGLRFGLVASNPPIRVGKAVLHDLCRSWLERLGDDGEAWWVMQKHLGSDSLQAWMGEQGWPTERVRSRQAYRILRSTRP